MSSTLELLEEIKNLVSRPKTVCCPATPFEILGITAGAALSASGDALGLVMKIAVPPSGVIYSATFFDLDDEGSQVDLEIFKRSIADVAWDAPFAPSDTEILNFITELNFFAFDDHGSCQTSEIKNIGKAYTVPNGFLYIQAVTRATPNIAAGNMPRIQLQILSDDPTWQER